MFATRNTVFCQEWNRDPAIGFVMVSQNLEHFLMTYMYYACNNSNCVYVITINDPVYFWSENELTVDKHVVLG